MKRCPACGSTNVRRSSIRGSEHGAHAFRSPYRCEDCRARYWVLSRKTRVGVAAAGVSVVTLTMLGLGLAFLVRYAAPPAAPAAETYPTEGQLLVPISAMPDQTANETHRYERVATEPLPATNLHSSVR